MWELDIKLDRRDAVHAGVVLQGSIDAHTVKRLERELAELQRAGANKILIDLTGLEYISSSGLMLLVTTRRDLQAAGGELLLVKPRPEIYKVFTMVGLMDLLAFVKSPEDGWKALK